MSHPLVRARINERISGDAGVWPVAWLAHELAGELPLRNALSVGCGIGNLERDLVAHGVVSSIAGIDVSPACVDDASARAAQAELSGHISYECGDAREKLAASRDLGAVFFHGSLHHFEKHDELLRLVRAALRPGGLLCIDEYAGPSRDEWSIADVMRPNLVYWSLARSIRRTRIVRAPVNRRPDRSGRVVADRPGDRADVQGDGEARLRRQPALARLPQPPPSACRHAWT